MCRFYDITTPIVPMSHNISQSLTRYVEYREGESKPSRQGFSQWLQQTHNFKPNAAQAIIYPLGPNQCGFLDLPLDLLRELSVEPQGFDPSRALRKLVKDDLNQSCQTIKCAFVVGACRREGMTNNEIRQVPLDCGWTGADGAAEIIERVGNHFVRHFRLIDDDGRPNGRFSLLFRC